MSGRRGSRGGNKRQGKASVDRQIIRRAVALSTDGGTADLQEACKQVGCVPHPSKLVDTWSDGSLRSNADAAVSRTLRIIEKLQQSQER